MILSLAMSKMQTISISIVLIRDKMQTILDNH